MAQIFTSNQVNHVYVATGLTEITDGKYAKPVKGTDNPGTMGIHQDLEGNLYFTFLGKGGLVRSDLITNIMYCKETPAKKMERVMNAVYVEVNSNAMDAGSNMLVGQDYLLRIEFQNPIGMSPVSKYWKYGVVHTGNNMTTSDFYKAMAHSLAINMSREAVKLVKVSLMSGTTATEVTAQTDMSTLTGSYDKIKIEEIEQAWQLGIKQNKPVIFKINNSTVNVTNNGVISEVYWADVTYSNGEKIEGGYTLTKTMETNASNIPAGDTLVNSKLAAELEYFAMGERADLYRQVGWPDYIPTEYMVDPTNQYGYDMIGIHYSYTGSNHAVQKSEKDITILIPRTSTDTDGELDTTSQGVWDAIQDILNPSATTTVNEGD